MTAWRGDLDDDCRLERYGMLAHAERMAGARWWFAISRGAEEVFNTANNQSIIKLKTGAMARAAAECCMELLR